MEEMVNIPGFPTEVSEKIEMPDIAELLSYPMFDVCVPEVFYKHASDFQKKLFEMCPIKGERKYITIYSSCHMVYPGMRAVTSYPKGSTRPGWHIDGLEHNRDEHMYPKETVHLLLGHCESVTEFNLHPLSIPNEGRTNHQFNSYMDRNSEEFGIIGKPIELGRIYTFQNHVHRPVEPRRLEFRYTWRVRETDRDDIPSEDIQVALRNRYLDIESQTRTANITRTDNGIVSLIYRNDRK